jgi:Spy/CpxP family protein refolding chaperone
MKTKIFAVIAIVVLATSGLAMAQGWGRGPGMGPGPGMGYGPGPQGAGAEFKGGFHGLNLTAEQTQKMQALRDGFFKETIPIRNEMTTKQLELRTLWSLTDPDQEKILAKQKEINALRAQLQEKGTKMRLEGLKVLTPEQQAQLKAFVGGFGGRGMGRGHGMRGGYGPGRGMNCGGGYGMGNGPGRW